MAVGYGIPCPKPEKGSSRRTRLTLRLKLGKAMRDAVWLRAGSRCEVCGRAVIRTLDVLREDAGHVAHEKGRRVAPSERFSPEAAKLKCRRCHLEGDHGMRF